MWWVETKNGRSGVIENEGDTPINYKKDGDKYFFKDRRGDVDVTKTMFIFKDFKGAVYPKLSDHTDLDTIDRMSDELKTRILEGARLTAVDTPIVGDVVDDRFFDRIDDRYIARYLRNASNGYRSLKSVHPAEDQLQAFYNFLRQLHDNSKEQTPIQIFKSKFQAQLKVVNAFKKGGPSVGEAKVDSVEEAGKDEKGEGQNIFAKGVGSLGDIVDNQFDHFPNFQEELVKLGGNVQDFERKFESFEKKWCSRMLQCYSGLPEFEDGELFKMMENMWRQRWLPLVFMRHIGAFNFDGPLTEAARLFKKKLATKVSFSDSLPPSGSRASQLTLEADGKENEILYVEVSADTKYVMFASKKVVQIIRVDDKTTLANETWGR
jgi:hypothetical protein